MNGLDGRSEDTSKEAAPKASLKLGFSEYRRISNLLVLHLRKAEEGKNFIKQGIQWALLTNAHQSIWGKKKVCPHPVREVLIGY